MSCISFKAHMARKVLDRKKTQTRRVITREERSPSPGYSWAECLCTSIDPSDTPCVTCRERFGDPAHEPSDVLWLREPLLITKVRERPWVPAIDVRGRYDADGIATDWIEYPARLAAPVEGKRVAYGCPREFSRATVQVTRVRVQRIAEITGVDALAEGIDVNPGRRGSADCYRNYLNGDGYCVDPVDSFRSLWDSINGKRPHCAWTDNPHVFVYDFNLVGV